MKGAIGSTDATLARKSVRIEQESVAIGLHLSLATDNVSLVTDRRAAASVAERVVDVMLATGNTPESVAEATDLTISDLNERLEGVTPFNIRELVQVGGFLRLSPSQFLKGVHA